MRKILSFLTAILFAGSMMADSYVKVTEAPTDWSGDYLIVYEGDATHDAVAFNGGLETLDANSNNVAVTITDGVIAATDELNAAKFTIAAVTGGYSVQAANGKFIGATSYANSLATADEAIVNNLSITDGNAVIGVTTSGGDVTLRYNYAKNTWRFRYYKSGQQAVALYKFVASQGGGDTPVSHTYTVAGDDATLFGTTWAPTNTDNDMMLVEGVYTWEKTNMTMPAGNVAFKVVEDHSWDNASYPADNYVLNIPEGGVYTITITYNPEGNVVAAVAQKTGSAVVIPTVAMHGNFGGQNWADTENFAVAEGNETASLTLNLAAGDYEFGMRIGGSGNWTANGAAFTRENNSAVIVAGQGNITLDADAAGEYTFTWTYATNTLTVTYPEYVEPTYNFADGYYLIGLDMQDWTMEYMPTEGRLFAANPDNEGEYQLTITLAVDQQFKVVSVQKDQIKNWYPDGMDNNYIVDAAHAGEKTVYFRPDGQGGQDWHYGCIYVAANEDQPEQPEEGSVIVKWDADAEQVIGQVIYHAAAATASTKIHNNEDDVTAINLSKSYKYADDQYVVIKPATGTFKAGDKVTFNTFINNATADGSKYGAVYFYAADGATVLFQGQNGINGRTSNDEPVVENFTLEADQDSIMFGRYGNTATYVSVLNVTRVGGDEPVIETPKFYVTGNAALVGQDKEWNPAAIASMNDTLVLNLEAGIDYVLKVAVNGTWEGENNVKGFNELTEKTKGLLDISDDHNIGFRLAEAGEVKVVYIAAAEEHPEVFKLIGDFYVYVPQFADGYYLVGNQYNWTPAAERLFTANPETEGEYFLAEVTLEENDSIKVVMVVNDEITDWYPNGDNYVVDAAHVGVKTIYFNPTYQEAWGNNIYIEANAAPFACDWNNIAWLDGSNEQIKVCKESDAVSVVNVQNPHWSEATEDGIYMTFPSADWGEISLPEGKYETQGAGLLVYLSALTQEYNEISIVCQDVEYIINVYNAANAPKPAFYLVGNFNEWTAAEAYKFGVDETCAEGEYILHATLTTGDEIKVIGILGNDTTWYPAEAGNYTIDDAHAGEAKAIYFRPEYHADWAAFGGYFWIGENVAVLEAPDAAPAAPTYAGYQVHAAYSATYNADCNFGEWGSGTQYTQEEFGKKYVTTSMGYFGLEFTGMDCSEMEALHLDVWVAADASIRIVPIHGGTEVGVTAQLQGQQWNAIDIALTDFAGVTNWSNVYQIKIDNAANLTFWLNNVYFYTTQEKTVDLVDGYYLIGNINGWDIHNLTADHLFAQNPDNEAEYVLHYTLAEGNEFKVVAVANNELGAWYPGEAGNYVVDFAHAGEKDIYFRPDYQGGADWHAGCIYVAVDESQVNPWETWFATGDTWNTETESYLEWDGENQKATIHINVDKNGQWRAQAKYHGPVAKEGKCYHVALKLKSNNAISNVTIKYQDNVEMVYVSNAALAANVEFVFDTIVAGLPNGNGIMVLDFGFAHAGDIIEIYDVVIEETECPATRLEDGFYLIGLGMADWTVDYITADYLFTANPSNEGEYMLNITLAKDQQFKVVSVANDAIVTWYPDGMDNNYVVDYDHSGETTIYFRPEGGVEGWHYGMIYVAPVDHTGVNNVDAAQKAVKIIRDGQLLIIKGEKTYTIMGQVVK